MTIKNPEIRKEFVVSASYLSDLDIILLDRIVDDCLEAHGQIALSKHEYGYKIHLSEDKEDNPSEEVVRSLGFSLCFARIFREGVEMGVEKLDFDQDGLTYEELNVYMSQEED